MDVVSQWSFSNIKYSTFSETKVNVSGVGSSRPFVSSFIGMFTAHQ